MISRLRKETIRQRRVAFLHAAGNHEGSDSKTEPTYTYGRETKLPYPQKLFRVGQQCESAREVATGPEGHTIIKSSAELRKRHYVQKAMKRHWLWVRVFDKHDRLLFNHANPQAMHTSQMIHLCTKLVNHLNSIAQTDELKVQEALGTLEETIKAQITPPPNGSALCHSWELQFQGNSHYDVGAITVIRQNKDNTFNGELVDDFVNTTFQLQMEVMDD